MQQVVNNIRQKLSTYLHTNKIQSVVMGISGGIDSAVCAALAKPVCDDLDIPLLGASIPITTNLLAEITRARKIGEKYCTSFEEIGWVEDVYTSYVEYKHMIDSDFKIRIRKGNIKARLRMIYLYDLAQEHEGIVLSTDNYTEYLLGFWTLHGDVGDYGMIQNLWKTEVYQLAEYLASITDDIDKKNSLRLCIDAIPTDGLGVTTSDFDQFGVNSYQEIDKILKKYLDGEIGQSNSIIQRHLKSFYKRDNPYNISRKDLFKNTNDDVDK